MSTGEVDDGLVGLVAAALSVSDNYCNIHSSCLCIRVKLMDIDHDCVVVVVVIVYHSCNHYNWSFGRKIASSSLSVDGGIGSVYSLNIAPCGPWQGSLCLLFRP